MSFFAGLASTDRSDPRGGDRLYGIATTYGGGGKPSVWRGDGAALVHVPRHFTPEDRLDRFPAAFAGAMSRLVFDGRLDNREALIAALELAPADAARLGDGGLLIAALERWGIDACPRLIGAFAFAWWDAASRQLVLAVDASGGRAIFAHDDGRRLCFATRPLAVLAFPDMERQIDEMAMAHLLLGRPIPTGATPFRGVFRLPPAGLLIWHDGTYSLRRYWQPDLARRISYRDPRDYVDAARELLDRITAPHLRAIGPVACQLSGGLDSSAVAATAARLRQPETLHTFTSYPDPATLIPQERPRAFYNEMSLARATAALYPNIDAHYLASGEISQGEQEPYRLFREFGIPVRNFTNLGAWEPLYAQARTLGASVMLVGTAGNCTLSWKSQALLADLAASGRFLALAGQLRGLKRHGYGVWPQVRWHLLAHVAPAKVRMMVRRLRGTADFWRRRAAASEDLVGSVDAAAIADNILIDTRRGDRDRRLRLVYLEKHWSNSQWMAANPYVSGCDLRDPLGDRRLVEFCLAVPDEIWQQGGQPRSFARAVLCDRLPPEVVNNQKRGYQNGDWFHRLTLLRPTFMAELERLEASPTARWMIDLPRIRAIAANWPADADAAMACDAEMLDLFGRGIHYGRFIRWVEGSNG
jgi:asparagine synthase (glutamine-hydrolysing)